MVRLAYAVSHPIQYQAPLLQRLAREPDIDLTVFYASDFSARGYYDRLFGCEVTWDVPLLEGYKYHILPRVPGTKHIHSSKPPSYGYLRAFTVGRFDAVWVHGYSTANSLHALLAGRAIGANTLLRTDSTLLDRNRGLVKQAFRAGFFNSIRSLVDVILTCGTMNAEYWQRMLPQKPQVLMPYAVDNAYFSNRAAEAEGHRVQNREALGLRADDVVFLFAAKLIPRKRCADLLHAFAKLDSPRARLLIVGDGRERGRLEELARQLFPDFGTASARVQFTGFQTQSEVPRWMSIADVFVLPSVFEPWALAVNEAMACRRTVIVSDEVGSAPDLVIDGETGFVYPARDIEGLADRLRRFVQNPGLCRTMGEAAFKRVSEWNFEADVRSLRTALKLPLRG